MEAEIRDQAKAMCCLHGFFVGFLSGSQLSLVLRDQSRRLGICFPRFEASAFEVSSGGQACGPVDSAQKYPKT